jgi:alkanesulfonate monooxygenase SsuD/methylene tetrahydromethanopterin reductase-like flavin-dependent oxidoreductase (luciferase family)
MTSDPAADPTHGRVSRIPALAVIGVPTKRRTILELAVEAERLGVSGLASPGIHGNLALCSSLAHVTSTIPFWTSIQPIYHSHHGEVAVTAGHLAEVSGGRFRLGLGVSHAPAMDRLGLATGKPLADMRAYAEGLRSSPRSSGELPPIWLATLRDRMLDLALEIGDGAIWANASLSYMPTQATRVPVERRSSFPLWNMVPTVIDPDLDAARAVHRKTLSGYVLLPNYRNYWKQAGYLEEMTAIETALAAGDREAVAAAMSDRWIDDCTISGSPAVVRDRFEAWFDAGAAPIAVMSSAGGGQAHAIGQFFDLLR